MDAALEEAQAAFEEGEVPVGAVGVKSGEVIARARNSKEALGDPTGHAEIELLRLVARQTREWRMAGLTVYVTLEPCPMCAGALILARIKRLIYGAPNLKSGAVESHLQLLSIPTFNHLVSVTAGILSEECAGLLKQFFRKKRNKNV